FSSQEIKAKLIKLLKATAAGFLFVLITAPIWHTFNDALESAYTLYNDPDYPPGVVQNPSGLLIGLFDEIFYRQMVHNEHIFAPASNFLLLLGVLWSIACLKYMLQNRTYIAVGLSSLVSYGLVFGAVPWELIQKIPYLRNVCHVDNTFSAVLIVHLFLLAGFGLKACWDGLKTKEWKFDWLVALFFLGMMLSLYFGSTKDIPKSQFFYGYVASLVFCFILLPWILRWLSQVSHATIQKMLITLLVVVMILLHWRHGMHLHLSDSFDKYVMNPQLRSNMQAPSEAIKFIKSDVINPFRAVGFSSNLFAGYNAAYGIEGINGPDALMNKHYRQLVKEIPFDWNWGWRIVVDEKKLTELRPFLDLLNVKYYLASHEGNPAELPELRLLGAFDLNVYTSRATWPRAFFTDKLSTYESVTEFVDMVKKGDGRPFAAFQKSDSEQYFELKDLQGDQKSRVVVPVTDYKLTTNITSFTVDAPSKGVIVLTEAFLKDDFKVMLNGKPVPYFRINHAFKGVVVDAPGRYTVSFSYWPRNFTRSIWMFIVGILLMVSWVLFTLRRYRSLKI
ncbi:MAG: hypothetical protein HY606_11360, partial [Planctomycetes bacterium]|nr:hypothetical protein [Planctomycetota bacterium]